MRATRNTPSTRRILLRAMHLDDAATFRALLDRHGWPEDEWSDYDLLVHAIRHNHRRVAHILLDKGARAKNNQRRANSALYLAAAKKTAGWSSVIVKLLSRGASVGDKNYKNETALHVAFCNGAPDEVIDVLLRAHVDKGMSEVFDKDMLGFVHVASTRSDTEMLRRILEADESLGNCQVSLKSNSTYAGYTPLHFAVDQGRLEIAEFLLQRGVDICRQDANGSTALHLALELRHVDMIDLILQYDEFNKNRVNNFGVSHFMAACAGSNEDLITSYFRSSSSTSALVNSQIDILGYHPLAGYTPLHFAAEFGRLRTVELLLSRDAECCVLTPGNFTPHVLAHQHQHEVIVEVLDRQCRTLRCFSEFSRIVGERYRKVIGEDEEGNFAIRFEKRGVDVDSSLDGDSDGESDDVARMTHDELVSLFVVDVTSDVQCDSTTVSEFDFDFLEKFDELFGNDAKDFNVENIQQVPLDLSTTRRLREVSNAQTLLYASLQNVCYADQTIKASSPTPSVRISWSPSTSRSYFELTIDSLNSDTGISLGSSFDSSRSRDSSQYDFTWLSEPVSFYHANASDYADPNESFEMMDYEAFAPVASSTLNKVEPVAMGRGDSFDGVVNANNNLFGDVRNVSFS